MSEHTEEERRAPQTSAEARAALAALDADSTRLSHRVVTPSWYRVLVAAAVALPLCALIIPRVHLATVVPWLVIWTPWMLGAYSRTRHGGNAVPRRPGRRSRRSMLLALAVLAMLAAIAVLVKLSALSSWLILLPAAASFLAALVLGRRYDAVVRAEIADPDGATVREGGTGAGAGAGTDRAAAHARGTDDDPGATEVGADGTGTGTSGAR